MLGLLEIWQKLLGCLLDKMVEHPNQSQPNQVHEQMDHPVLYVDVTQPGLVPAEERVHLPWGIPGGPSHHGGHRPRQQSQDVGLGPRVRRGGGGCGLLRAGRHQLQARHPRSKTRQ